ncbi:voltage-gated potassium channel [Xylariaceae sp. FL0662B]|nr:voltage-gated potassium channel [Xylariaceae sp. FL0662B]
MNDANLNENIGEQTRAIDGHDHEEIGHNAIMSDQAHLDPTRWWFASAAFPMIAGTLGPVASAFSICALVQSWRQYIPPASDVTKAIHIKDPPWLLAINAVQLFIALAANLFLLLNMTKRVRFSVAQPVTITGWYMSAICLVALCATASGPLALEPEIEYVWSQAFCYGMYAAILYFIVASLMVVTVWGAATGHYGKDFELTTSQRTLMLQTIMFLMYLLLGALVFSKIEGWTFLDSVYWADVTLFTVGYGDFYPQTSLGRGLLMPYALVGITSLGLVIGSIRHLMLDRGKHRLDARMLEKERRRLIRRAIQKGKEGILEPIDGDVADAFPELASSKLPRTEFERRQREFQLMRKLQRKVSKRRRWIAMAVSFTTWVILWLVGAKIFQECEYPYQGWTYFEAFYFAFTALTTIGYGDVTPVSNSAKSFFVFWSLLALPTMTVLISHAGDTVVKGIKDGTLRLGNLTILPGEHSFKKETKQLLAKLSCGFLFTDEDVEEDPPGFLGAAQPHSEDEEESGLSENDNPESYSGAKTEAEKNAEDSEPSLPSSDPTAHTRRGGSDPRKPTARSARKRDARPQLPPRDTSAAGIDAPTKLPKTRAEYHLVLIDEISRVTNHLQSSPPRKYTFKEWAWYLRLIGEDESSATTHRQPTRKSRKHRHPPPRPPALSTSSSSPPAIETSARGGGSTQGDGDEKKPPPPKWSWVGHLSPLMDTREEAEWILDKLEQRLRAELQAAVLREQEQEQDGSRATGEAWAGLRKVEAEEGENEQ